MLPLPCAPQGGAHGSGPCPPCVTGRSLSERSIASPSVTKCRHFSHLDKTFSGSQMSLQCPSTRPERTLPALLFSPSFVNPPPPGFLCTATWELLSSRSSTTSVLPKPPSEAWASFHLTRCSSAGHRSPSPVLLLRLGGRLPVVPADSVLIPQCPHSTLGLPGALTTQKTNISVLGPDLSPRVQTAEPCTCPAGPLKAPQTYQVRALPSLW